MQRKLTKHSANIVPTREWLSAIWCWVCVIVPYFIGWVLTFPMSIPVALTSRYQAQHPQGKKTKDFHKPHYIVGGSSGEWEYWNPTSKWLKWWGNYEDGTFGEPSGKHSAREKGNERSILAQIRWTVRNPFNYAKRTLPLFHCMIDECDVEYWGDFELSDKENGKSGWYFVKATHKVTNRKYYCYRSVKFTDDGMVRQMTIGFKIKPSHALQVQDVDDKDKAFTIRLPVKTNID